MATTEEESSTPHMKTEMGPVAETLFSSYLEFRTMDKVYKPRDSSVMTHRQNPSDLNQSVTKHVEN
jgi:hypothetical protein